MKNLWLCCCVCDMRKFLIGGSVVLVSVLMFEVDNCFDVLKWCVCSVLWIDILMGVMMNSDRISVMLFSMRFGGICWILSVECSRLSMIISFV